MPLMILKLIWNILHVMNWIMLFQSREELLRLGNLEKNSFSMI